MITDVKELFDWEVEHLELHPMFARLPQEEIETDPCIRFMREGTDEAKKVIRNQGSMWYSVYRKWDVSEDAAAIEEQMARFF